MRLCCFGGGAVEPEGPSPAELEEGQRLERVARCNQCTRVNEGRLVVKVFKCTAGVLQRANARNRNGRIYPKDILKREADRFYDTHVLRGCAFGELDHPDPNSPLFRSLDGRNVSHQVLDYWWEGDDLVGVLEVLPTSKGEALKTYFYAGRKLGVSSRGWATLQDNGDGIYIQDDFELITFDFVSDPSTEGAFFLPMVEQFKGLKPMVSLKGFDTVPSHALSQPPKAARAGPGKATQKAAAGSSARSAGAAPRANGNGHHAAAPAPPWAGKAGDGAQRSPGAVVNGFEAKRGPPQRLAAPPLTAGNRAAPKAARS